MPLELASGSGNHAQPMFDSRKKAYFSIRLIKRGIWLYFFLLIFEGALRKWFLPSLATPLLIVRDPIALYLIVSVWTKYKFPVYPYLIAVALIGIIGIITAVLFGHGNLIVALYGARILLLHLPLVFIIGYYFDRTDVIEIGKATLWITIPMTVLIALQFYSPQSAWVNIGVAGDTKGAGFSGALGYFRPPATFSFTNGTTLFFSFASCFVLYFWVETNSINRLLLLCATIGVLIAIPLSISRALFFQVILSVAFVGVANLNSQKSIGKLILAAVTLFILVLSLSQFKLFQTSTEAFINRFTVANEVEGGLEGVFLDRYLGGMIASISGSSVAPFWGYGLGMGTNVGSLLLTGNRIFLISEGEWGRIIGELGPLFGLILILLRVNLAFQIAIASYKRLLKGDILPWILLSFGLLLVAQGGWAQPTALGFFTIMGGLMLASIRRRHNTIKSS